MIRPDLLQDLHDMPSEELREVIAHAAGIHAHRDGDGGAIMAQALGRIIDRLEYKPRVRTA